MPVRFTSLSTFLCDFFYGESRELPYLEWRLTVTVLACTLSGYPDERVVAALTRLLDLGDPEIADAARSSLARIGRASDQS